MEWLAFLVFWVGSLCLMAWLAETAIPWILKQRRAKR